MLAEKTVSYSEARNRLAALLDQVELTQGSVVITRRGHANVVLITQEELSGLIETAHLLRSPANAHRLLEAIERSLKGQSEELTLEELVARTS